MKVEIKNGTIFIELPISPRPSASGKSLVIASTAGNQATTATHDGKPVIIGVNAYTKK
jgi:hypothetical protein